jgi:endoglucanase
MKRREFTLSLGAAAVLTACGGGGGGSSDGGSVGTGSSAAPSAGPGAAPGPVASGPTPPAPAPGPAPAPAPVALQFAIGTNLASMELGAAIRYGANTLPNVNFAVPRDEDVKYLADHGFKKSRLPIRWELLQPVLYDSKPNKDTLGKIGVTAPGAFHPGYAAFITQVLDAHAKAGTKCIIDVHNYCRYTDFIYQPDGSVKGLQKPNSVAQAFTTDGTQVFVRIMALADGATLKIPQYVDFMARLVNQWKDHPGLGGIGLMNEPYAMPKPGETIENDPNLPPIYSNQDYTIWPTFAAAAIKAIRAIDPSILLYLGGNNWSNPWGLGTENPGFPIDAQNIVYEVHCYLDATNSGQGANWDVQVAQHFTAGIDNNAPIDTMTGAKRLQLALDFAAPRKMQLALTETGMPTDDPRWQQSWTNMLGLAKANNVEVYSWGGGSYWQYHGEHFTNIPTWYQNRPAESQQGGAMMAVAQSWNASIFDAGPGWGVDGSGAPAPVTITVYARGALQNAITITVSSDNGGTFKDNKRTLVIPAGANGSDSFTFTPKANTVTTLTYASPANLSLPPARKVYSLTDPVTPSLSFSLEDRAMALLAKYSAAKWDMGDGYTDPLYGVPCANGQELRAVSDSGYGSSAGNELEMVNWFNTGAGMGPFTLPKMATVSTPAGSRKAADMTKEHHNGLRPLVPQEASHPAHGCHPLHRGPQPRRGGSVRARLSPVHDRCDLGSARRLRRHLPGQFRQLRAACDAGSERRQAAGALGGCQRDSNGRARAHRAGTEHPDDRVLRVQRLRPDAACRLCGGECQVDHAACGAVRPDASWQRFQLRLSAGGLWRLPVRGRHGQGRADHRGNGRARVVPAVEDALTTAFASSRWNGPRCGPFLVVRGAARR